MSTSTLQVICSLTLRWVPTKRNYTPPLTFKPYWNSRTFYTTIAKFYAFYVCEKSFEMLLKMVFLFWSTLWHANSSNRGVRERQRDFLVIVNRCKTNLSETELDRRTGWEREGMVVIDRNFNTAESLADMFDAESWSSWVKKVSGMKGWNFSTVANFWQKTLDLCS